LTRDQHRNSPETVPTTNKQIKQQYLHIPRDPDELQPLVQDLVKVVGRGFVSQRDEEQAAYNMFLDTVET
jgi:hypothetical protein